MNRLITVPLGILALALLCFLCISFHAPVIQSDIYTHTAQALNKSGVASSGMSVSGRDVLLSGPAGSPIVSDQARTLAAAVYGVRVVNVETTSAPAATPADAKVVEHTAQTQQQVNTVLQNRIVEFNSESATLTDAGRETLNQIVPILAASPTLQCKINGYTDSTGEADFNLTLSKRRAEATKDYMVSRGIAASRLTAEGFGQSNPLATNDTPEGRRQNRRIEFLLRESN